MFFKGRFELGQYGSEFSGSYIIFRLPDKNKAYSYTVKITKLAKEVDKEEDEEKAIEKAVKVTEFLYDYIKEHFISGVIYDADSKEERPMKPSDISEFPLQIAKDLRAFLEGQVQKKS